jgi:hypothetical protein
MLGMAVATAVTVSVVRGEVITQEAAAIFISLGFSNCSSPLLL